MRRYNIIFLEIDHVLNTVETIDISRPPTIDPYLVDNFLALLSVIPDPAIVITSDWRRIWAKDKLFKYLSEFGIPVKFFVSITPVYPGSTRGTEITSWLERNAEYWKNLVILDNRNDMDHLVLHLIKTDQDQGLKLSDIGRAKKILMIK